MIEERGLPYAIAVNTFDDSPSYDPMVLRDHLDLTPETPLVTCDARDPGSTVDALIALVSHLLANSAMDNAV